MFKNRMFVIEGYKELIGDLKEQIRALHNENYDLMKENRNLRNELLSSAEKPAELVDRILSVSGECDDLRDANRELRYKLADYENAEKVAQGSLKEN